MNGSFELWVIERTHLPGMILTFSYIIECYTNRQINKIEATHQIIRRKKKTETSTCSFANKKNVRIRIVCWKVFKCKVPSKFIHKLICSSSSKGHLIHHWKRKKKLFCTFWRVLHTFSFTTNMASIGSEENTIQEIGKKKSFHSYLKKNACQIWTFCAIPIQ